MLTKGVSVSSRLKKKKKVFKVAIDSNSLFLFNPIYPNKIISWNSSKTKISLKKQKKQLFKTQRTFRIYSICELQLVIFSSAQQLHITSAPPHTHTQNIPHTEYPTHTHRVSHWWLRDLFCYRQKDKSEKAWFWNKFPSLLQVETSIKGGKKETNDLWIISR